MHKPKMSEVHTIVSTAQNDFIGLIYEYGLFAMATESDSVGGLWDALIKCLDKMHETMGTTRVEIVLVTPNDTSKVTVYLSVGEWQVKG